MDNSELIKTQVMDSEDLNLISIKLAAVNNKVRFSILEILRDFQKVNIDKNNNYKKDPLYSRELNGILLKDYDIKITPQMLGQHLKQLMEADLIEEISIKKEVPNKIGRRNVKAYVLKEDAFKDLFLEINFLSDELLSFFDFYDVNQKFHDEYHCVLTVFNGADKGKTFKLNKNDVTCIGRKSNNKIVDSLSVISLDDSYSTVSNVSKPHLKIFYEDGYWYVLDDSSSNGTFISDRKVPNGVVTKLKNNSFLKLSKGPHGAVIYCSY